MPHRTKSLMTSLAENWKLRPASHGAVRVLISGAGLRSWSHTLDPPPELDRLSALRGPPGGQLENQDETSRRTNLLHGEPHGPVGTWKHPPAFCLYRPLTTDHYSYSVPRHALKPRVRPNGFPPAAFHQQGRRGCALRWRRR